MDLTPHADALELNAAKLFSVTKYTVNHSEKGQ